MQYHHLPLFAFVRTFSILEIYTICVLSRLKSAISFHLESLVNECLGVLFEPTIYFYDLAFSPTILGQPPAFSKKLLFI